MLIEIQIVNTHGDFCENPKNMNVEGGWKLKFIFCFNDKTHKQLHLQLDKWSLVQ
jgi:hypothetical protein